MEPVAKPRLTILARIYGGLLAVAACSFAVFMTTVWIVGFGQNLSEMLQASRGLISILIALSFASGFCLIARRGYYPIIVGVMIGVLGVWARVLFAAQNI